MSYVQARFRKKPPPPNPIAVGCLGAIVLAVLGGISSMLLTLAGRRFVQVTPAALRDMMKIPLQWVLTISGNVKITIPLTDGVIMGVEVVVLTMLLFGLVTTLYSFYYDATREKEGWELYAEEAERQAKLNRAKH